MAPARRCWRLARWDSVTVGGPSGAQMQTITGSASVAAALFTGNTALSGSFSAGALTLGGSGSGGVLQLGRGTSLQAGSASIASGSVVAGPGSTVSVSGTMSLGAAGGAAALDATGGGAACVLAMLMTSAADSIYVDPTSIVEVGSAGAPSSGDQAGCLTIDVGASLIGQGSADAYGSVVNNGTLAASGGTLSVGVLGGTGTLQIGASATLALNGRLRIGPGGGVLRRQRDACHQRGAVRPGRRRLRLRRGRCDRHPAAAPSRRPAMPVACSRCPMAARSQPRSG